ncbi:MAG: hypothetical protein HC867_06380 [Bacteroidia bacterium]|nr:hypothetical protein [Bacteroidia bacterium]
MLSADQFRDLVNAQGTAAQKALLGTQNTDWQDIITATHLLQIIRLVFPAA